MELNNLDNLEEEKGFDYEKYIVDPDDINKNIKDFHEGKIKKGYGTGLSIVDKYIVSKEKEFYAVVGKKGDGKTTIQQIFFLMWSIANGLKWCVCFKENKDWGTKLNLLDLLLGARNSEVKKSDPLLYEKASVWIDEHFTFLNIDDMKTGTEVCKALIENGKQVHALVLDPANSFFSGWFDTGNEFSDGRKTAINLLHFTETVCSIHLSQHPTMAGQRKEGIVTSKEAEGGWYFNKASFTYNANRERGTNVTMIGVENVRNKFTGGGVTHPDTPLMIHWSPYKIDVECNGEKEEDVIQLLRMRHNPLNELFSEFQEEKPQIPMINPEDAFGTDEDVLF